MNSIAHLSSKQPYHQKKLLMMVPDNFMWPEYSEPREIYEKAGIEVVLATKDGKLAHPDPRNKTKFDGVQPLAPELSFKDVEVGEFDAVTTVGGNGAWEDFFPNTNAHRILKDSLDQGKVTGLICASTGTLAMIDNFDESDHSKVEGRQVTGYWRVENLLRKVGKVDFVDGEAHEVTVVVDDNLITGRNPESSKLFGETIVEALKEN